MEIENGKFVIQSGNPNFLRSGRPGGTRKDSELIRVLKQLKVDQYIHIPASKGNTKSVYKVVKNSIAVAKNQMKSQNPNLYLSYGIAIDNNVYGISIVRKSDKTPDNKSNRLFNL